MRQGNKKKDAIVSVTDGEMMKSGAWVIKHLKRTTFFESVFVSYLCGYFHTFPVQARAIVDDMVANGLVTKDGDTITWIGQ